MERLMGAGAPDDPSMADTLVQSEALPRGRPASELRQIGPYHLLEKIGEGGFGIVYRAEQLEPVRRRVAVKIIRPGMASAEIVARFEAERQALAMMEHPNIARVYDAGTTPEGLPYFVMEFVDGAPLTTFCDARRMPVRERLALFAEVCDAVQHAHQKAILHRDLKPSNVLVAEVDGKPVPKVIDFGIAKALEITPEQALHASLARTQAGIVVGTPQYMSPEQAGSVPDVDTRSDVYTLGIILHELLTGQTPLSRDELKNAAFDEVLRMIREVETRRPSSRLTPATDVVRQSAITRQTESTKLSRLLRGELDWIMLKALEKERERRYQSASLLAEDVRRYLRHEPVSAGPPQVRYRAMKFLRRNRGPIAAAATIAITLIGATVFSARQAILAKKSELHARDQKTLAESESDKRRGLLQQASKFTRRFASTMAEASMDKKSRLAFLASALTFDPDNAAANLDAQAELLWDSDLHAKTPRVVAQLDSWIQWGFRDRTPDRKWSIIIDQPKLVPSIALLEGKERPSKRRELDNESPIDKAGFIGLSTAATCSHDGTIKLWDCATAKLKATLRRHTARITDLALSADGKMLVTASFDSSVVFWDMNTMQQMGEPVLLSKPAIHISLSADGRLLGTSSSDGDTIWSIQNRAPETKLTRGQGERSSRSLLFSWDCRLLASWSESSLRVFSVSSGQVVSGPLEHSALVNYAAFSPDSQWLVTASNDASARVWRVTTGASVASLPHHCAVLSAEFSSDGRWLLTDDLYQGYVWDFAFPSAPYRAVHHGAYRPANVVNKNGLWTMRSLEGGYCSWRQDDLSLAYEVSGTTGSPIFDARFDESQGRILKRSGGFGVQVFDVKTNAPTTMSIHSSASVTHAAFSPDGTRVATVGTDKIARVSDARSGDELVSWPCPILIEPVKFSPDGAVIAAVMEKSVIIRSGTPPFQELRELKIGYQPSSLHFTPSGRILVVNGRTVWDVSSGKLIASLGDADQGILGLAACDKGPLVAHSHGDKEVHVFDVRTGKLAFPVLHHLTSTVQFSPDGKLLLSASYGGKDVRVWDAGTGEIVGIPLVHEGPVSAAGFSEDGRHLMSATQGHCRLFELPVLENSDAITLRGMLTLAAGTEVNLDGGLRSLLSTEQGRLRDELLRDAAAQPRPVGNLARWWLAHPRSRNITPSAPISIPDMIEHYVAEKDNSAKSVEDAFDLDPLHPLVHVAMAAHELDPWAADRLREFGVSQRLTDPENAELYGRERVARYAGLCAEALLKQHQPENNALRLAVKALEIAEAQGGKSDDISGIKSKISKLQPPKSEAGHAPAQPASEAETLWRTHPLEAAAIQKGAMPVRAEAIKNDGIWELAVFPWGPMDNPMESPERWRRLADGEHVLRGRAAALEFDFGLGQPTWKLPGLDGDARLKSDDFGIVATAQMHLSAGRWKCRLSCDDGGRVIVNGNVVVDDWSHHVAREMTGVFDQKADDVVEVRVEYFEMDGAARLHFSVSKE